MKGKYLPFLILPMLAVAFFLVSPLVASAATTNPEEVQEKVEDWRDSSKCVAACGSTKGTKSQILYKEVCEKSCPTREFSASREVLVEEGYYEECPEGYEEMEGENQCVMEETRYATYVWVQTGRLSCDGNWACPEDDSAYTTDRYFWFLRRKYEKPCSREFVVDTIDKVYVDPVYETETYGPIDVKYLFDFEAEVCTRPSADIVISRCDLWAMEFYNQTMPVSLGLVDTNTCELVPTKSTRSVDCEAELVACPKEDKPAVLGTTSVVLAETGASSNIFVYVVQSVLMLTTLVSGTLFVKKYII